MHKMITGQTTLNILMIVLSIYFFSHKNIEKCLPERSKSKKHCEEANARKITFLKSIIVRCD